MVVAVERARAAHGVVIPTAAVAAALAMVQARVVMLLGMEDMEARARGGRRLLLLLVVDTAATAAQAQTLAARALVVGMVATATTRPQTAPAAPDTLEEVPALTLRVEHRTFRDVVVSVRPTLVSLDRPVGAPVTPLAPPAVAALLRLAETSRRRRMIVSMALAVHMVAQPEGGMVAA